MAFSTLTRQAIAEGPVDVEGYAAASELVTTFQATAGGAVDVEGYAAAYDLVSTVGALIFGFGISIMYDALKEDAVLEDPWLNTCFTALGVVVVTYSFPATVALTFRSSMLRRTVALAVDKASSRREVGLLIAQSSHLSKPCVAATILAAHALLLQVALMLYTKLENEMLFTLGCIGGIPIVFCMLCLPPMGLGGRSCRGLYFAMVLSLLLAVHATMTHKARLEHEGLILLLICAALLVCYAGSVCCVYCMKKMKKKIRPEESDIERKLIPNDEATEETCVVRKPQDKATSHLRFSRGLTIYTPCELTSPTWSPTNASFLADLLQSVRDEANLTMTFVSKGLLDQEDIDVVCPQHEMVKSCYAKLAQSSHGYKEYYEYYVHGSRLHKRRIDHDVLSALKHLHDEEAITSLTWQCLKKAVFQDPVLCPFLPQPNWLMEPPLSSLPSA